jgi:hypothetical protein
MDVDPIIIGFDSNSQEIFLELPKGIICRAERTCEAMNSSAPDIGRRAFCLNQYKSISH